MADISFNIACKELKITQIAQLNHLFQLLLPPQGFRPEAKSRGGTLVTRAYIKDSTYSSNIIDSQYTRKILDLLELEPRGIGR